MIVTGLIERKRDGGRLTDAEWRALVHAYAANEVPDYQMAAMLMAAFERAPLGVGETPAVPFPFDEAGDDH